MSTPATINDLEHNKFAISAGGDVYTEIEQVVEDPLVAPTGTIDDLEYKKFTDDNKLRVVFTV